MDVGPMEEKYITYEQPLNERIRQFLRLEHLFQQAAYTLSGATAWESRSSLSCLTDIIEILSRNDIKTDLLKFLERIQTNLSQLKDNADIDYAQLESILEQLTHHYNRLHAVSGNIAQPLKEHHLISSLLQRNAVTAGVNSFDLPLLHHWLQHPAEDRVSTLQQWYDTLDVIRQPIELVLDLIRNSAEPVTVKAEQGFYQQSLALDTHLNRTFQLIRVTIPLDAPCFAEISGGKHRVSVRFLQSQDRERPVQAKADISFQLSCCAL